MMKNYFVLAGLILLAGCNTITGTRSYSPGALSYFNYAAAGKDFPVVTIARLDGPAKTKLESLIRAELDQNWSYLKTNFVAGSASGKSADRFVFVINPTKETYRDAICTATQANALPGPGVHEIVAGYCSDVAHTEIRANFDGAQNIDSDRVTDALAFMAWQIVSRNDTKNVKGMSEGL